MATSSEMAASDRGIRPLMQIVLPEKAEEVISFHADAELQQRIDELAEKSTEASPKPKERSTPVMSGRTNSSPFCSNTRDA